MGFILSDRIILADIQETGESRSARVKSVLGKMDIGEIYRWPIENTPYIRTIVNVFGAKTKRKFSTRTEPDVGFVYIQRIS